MVDVFSGNFSNDMQNTINKSISNFKNEAIADCLLFGEQQINFLVDNSTLEVSDDVVLEQKAKLVFSCVQSQSQNTELIEKFKAHLKTDLEQSLKDKSPVSVGGVNLSNTIKKVANIVDNNVDLALKSSCTAKIVQASDTKIKNSTVRIGSCTSDLVQALEKTCQSGHNTLALMLASGKPVSEEDKRVTLANCEGLRECAASKGKFLIEQGVDFEGECNISQNIALAITKEVETTMETKIEQAQTGFSFGVVEIVALIVAGVVLVALVSALVAYFRSKAKKKKKQDAKARQLERDYYGPGAVEPVSGYYDGGNAPYGTSYESQAPEESFGGSGEAEPYYDY